MCVCHCGLHGVQASPFLLLLQQSNLEAFKTAILAKAPDNELAEVWLKLLNQLIEDIER